MLLPRQAGRYTVGWLFGLCIVTSFIASCDGGETEGETAGENDAGEMGGAKVSKDAAPHSGGAGNGDTGALARGGGGGSAAPHPDASGRGGGVLNAGGSRPDTTTPTDSSAPPQDAKQPIDPSDVERPNDSGTSPPKDAVQDGSSESDSSTSIKDDAAARSIASVSVVSNTVLSSNATATKSYDTNVNISSFRHHGLLYYGGYQYVSWFNGNTRNAIVARRSIDPATMTAGTWQWAYVDFILASGADSHNVISMGVSPTDGRLHLAIGQHGTQLYYIRSVANAVTQATWDNSAFGGTGTNDETAAAPAAGLPGYTASTNTVTYPYFMNAADTSKTLQFAYRTGSSGNGEMHLAEYNASTGNWTYVGRFTGASGTFTQNGVTSTTRNAYPQGFNYDATGRLHMAFTWRENLSLQFIPNCSDTISNHDTLYVYSDDRGRTWKNSSGASVATAGASTVVTVSSPGIVIDSLPIGRDLMNQETQLTDHGNLFHTIISYVPDRYQAGCATNRDQAQPFHLWRSKSGIWTKDEVRLNGQDVNQGYDRSKAFVDSVDNLYLVLPDLRVIGATAASSWTDWQMLYDGRSLGNYGETIIDYELTRVSDAVSVLYLKDTSASTGELHVLDLKLTR